MSRVFTCACEDKAVCEHSARQTVRGNFHRTKATHAFAALRGRRCEDARCGSQYRNPLDWRPGATQLRRADYSGLTFSAMHLRKLAGKPEWEDAQGTYLIPGVGVFQRAAKGASELIYAFKAAPRVKPVLEFVKIAQATFAQEWAAHIARALRN